jgi:hypothetical protein
MGGWEVVGVGVGVGLWESGLGLLLSLWTIGLVLYELLLPSSHIKVQS